MRRFPLLLLLTLTFALWGCGQSNESGGASADADADDASWRLTSAPDGALGVVKVKAAAAAGDRVVVRGKIGGRMEPISPDSGLFVIMDPALPSCADNLNDGCPTPWDYCCELPETIAANAATVQLRQADGTPVVLSEGQLKPLNEVIVVGTVAQRPNDQTLVVTAEGVYVAQ